MTDRRDTRPGCRRCKGEQWINVQTKDDEHTMLMPCPTCLYQTYRLWDAGAYDLDAAGSKSPEFASLVEIQGAKR